MEASTFCVRGAAVLTCSRQAFWWLAASSICDWACKYRDDADSRTSDFADVVRVSACKGGCCEHRSGGTGLVSAFFSGRARDRLVENPLLLSDLLDLLTLRCELYLDSAETMPCGACWSVLLLLLTEGGVAGFPQRTARPWLGVDGVSCPRASLLPASDAPLAFPVSDVLQIAPACTSCDALWVLSRARQLGSLCDLRASSLSAAVYY